VTGDVELLRDRRQLLVVVCLITLGSIVGCEKSDPLAEAMLREAVTNAYGFLTKGEMKVTATFEGTTVTPWYRIHKGTDSGGAWRHFTPLKNHPLFEHGTRPSSGKVIRTTRGSLTGGQGGLQGSSLGKVTVDYILDITDIGAFLKAHTLTRATGASARKVVAGRRVVHLVAAPREPGELSYQIFVDEDKKFILGMEERDRNNRLRHAFEYHTIHYLPHPLATPLGPGKHYVKRPQLSPGEAAQILGMDVKTLFPTAAPPGFQHREIPKTGALGSIQMRFSNGTTTGVILLFVKKPSFRDVHVKPGSASTEGGAQKNIRDLVLSGHAFVDGQFIGLTFKVDSFHCVEMHTTAKSVLAMSTAGLDKVKELVTVLPLP